MEIEYLDDSEKDIPITIFENEQQTDEGKNNQNQQLAQKLEAMKNKSFDNCNHKKED